VEWGVVIIISIFAALGKKILTALYPKKGCEKEK